MFHAEAYLPILVAAVVKDIVGMFWFSDMLFGPMWKKMGGKISTDKDIVTKIALGFIASLIAATALFIAIAAFQKAHNFESSGIFLKLFSIFFKEEVSNNNLFSALKIAAFLWFGFLAPSKAILTIWGSGNWYKFLIASVGELVGFLAMAASIALLS